MTNAIKSPVVTTVRKDGEIIHYKVVTPYHRDIVDLLRDIPKAKWHADVRAWIVPAKSRDDLLDALPEIEQLAQEVNDRRAKEEQEREAEKAARQAQYRAEKEARDAEMARVRAQRTMVLFSDRPKIGVPVRLNGRVVVAESYGKPWVLTSEASEYHSCFLLPSVVDRMVGREVCYAYWRPATPAEEVTASTADHRQVEQAAMIFIDHVTDSGREMPVDY
jgi:hypothetical protein